MAKTNAAAMRFTGTLMPVVGGYAIASNAMPVLMNHFIDEFGLVSVQQGLMNAMFNVGSMVSVFTMVLLQGRVNKAVMIFISACMQALMLALTGASFRLLPLLAAYTLLGLAIGWEDQYANAAMVDVHGTRSAKFLSMMHGIFSAASFLTPVIIQALLLRADWRGIYFVFAAATGVIALQFAVLAMRPGARRSDKEALEPTLTLRDVKDYMRDDKNRLLLLSLTLFMVGTTGMTGWIVRYMTVRFNAETLGAAAISLFWICTTVCRFTVSWLKTPAMKLHVYGTLLGGSILTLAVLLNSAVVMFAACGALGLLTGQCIAVLLNENMSRYPGRTTLPASAMFFVMRASSVVIPLVQGALSGADVIWLSMLIPAVMMVLAAPAGWAIWKKIEESEKNTRSEAEPC